MTVGRPGCGLQTVLSLSLMTVALLTPPPPSAEALALHKRAPFSSWAGKRSSGLTLRPAEMNLHSASDGEMDRADLQRLIRELEELYLLDKARELEEEGIVEDSADEEVVKRAPFSSWAGKRAPFSSWAGKKRKRAPFSSWAGKRKRAPFSSWAGKRSGVEAAMGVPPPNWVNEEEEELEKHRVKRSSDEQQPEVVHEMMHSRPRRGAPGSSFSAWGGKRNANLALNSRPLRRFTRAASAAVAGSSVPVRVLRPQRAAFSAWGG